MEEVDLDLLMQYPLIKKLRTKDGFSYTGIVEINNEDYKIHLKHKKDKYIFGELDKLDYLKNEVNDLLSKKPPHHEIEALNILKEVVEKKLPESQVCIRNRAVIFMKVLHEYTEFTKFYLNLKTCCLLPDFSKITLSISDENQRIHSIEIGIDLNECTNIFKLEKWDLPANLNNNKLLKTNSSLMVLFDLYLGVLEALQPYFDFMDHVDKTGWILDPLHPRRGDFYRRINLGENTSVTITVDPYNIKFRPDMRFLGPERIVELYRNKLNDKLETWDVNEDPYQQMLNLLGLDCLPGKPTDQARDVDLLRDEGECCICFCFRLNDKVPDLICKNECCENSYHSDCLYEWLISVNARKVFSDIVGACPNCEKAISCPIPV